MLFSSSQAADTADGTVEKIATLSASTITVIVEILIAVGLAALVLVLLKKLFRKYLGPPTEEISKERRTMMRILYSVLRFAVFLICVLSILSTLGMDISGAFAACGIAAACGALAVQDLLKDLIQGMNIVTDRYFAMGDIIEYNGFTGKVISLTMRSTKIKSLDDASVKTIGNHFLTEVTLVSTQVNLFVSLSYDVDYEAAGEVMRKLAEKIAQHKEVTDAAFRGTQSFDDSAIRYLIVYHCNPEVMNQVKRDVNLMIQQTLKEANMEIPYNQMDIHMK